MKGFKEIRLEGLALKINVTETVEITTCIFKAKKGMNPRSGVLLLRFNTLSEARWYLSNHVLWVPPPRQKSLFCNFIRPGSPCRTYEIPGWPTLFSHMENASWGVTTSGRARTHSNPWIYEQPSQAPPPIIFLSSHTNRYCFPSQNLF